MNRRMFTLSVKTKLQTSGLILSGYKEAEDSGGLEITRIQRLMSMHDKRLVEAWNEYFRI